MSIPRNHHFVSQVLIKKFLGANNNLNIYSKSENKVIIKPFERQDFAVRDLNSIISNNGEIDHKSVEDNLNLYFETEFNKYYDLLIKSIDLNDHENFVISIKYLIRMGIIGDMRTPEHQLEMQNVMFQSFGGLYEMFSDELKQEYHEFLESVSSVKNKTPLVYNELCDKILKIMGEVNYHVFKVADNNYFFLPDNTSVIHRSKLEPDIETKDGKILETPGLPISAILYPINSEIIILVESKKISSQKQNGIYQLSEKVTIDYNKLFIENSRDKVVCSNERYLKDFINKHI